MTFELNKYYDHRFTPPEAAPHLVIGLLERETSAQLSEPAATVAQAEERT